MFGRESRFPDFEKGIKINGTGATENTEHRAGSVSVLALKAPSTEMAKYIPGEEMNMVKRGDSAIFLKHNVHSIPMLTSK